MGCGSSNIKTPAGYPDISVEEIVNGDMDVMDIVEESKNYLQSRLGIKKTSEDMSWKSEDQSTTAALETEEVLTMLI